MAGQDDTKGEIELVPTTADGALADNDNRSCGSPRRDEGDMCRGSLALVQKIIRNQKFVFADT
jgi:hypothetical protein